MTVEKQVAIIYAGSKGLLKKVPVNRVKEFEKEYLNYLDAKHKNVLNDLKAGKINDEITDILSRVASELSDKY
jgi:F-type H+-transporting ATPase subunit alpha